MAGLALALSILSFILSFIMFVVFLNVALSFEKRKKQINQSILNTFNNLGNNTQK